MDDDLNYIKCPKCEHDRNPATAAKCEICGTPLRRGASVLPLLGAGLAVLAILAGGGYFLKDKIPGLAPQPVTNRGTVPTSSPQNSPVAVAPQTTQTQEPPLIQGAVVATYRQMAEVPNVPQGVFNYGGSTTFAPLRANIVVGAISQTYPQFQLRYTEPITGNPGSGKGIEMLLAGELSVAQSSRSLKDDEYARAKSRGFTLEEVPVAIDGIAIYINPDLATQGVKGLTLEQLQKIFTGKIRNWNQVGGPNLPIVAFSRNLKAGGTVDFFYEHILEKQPLGASVKEIRDTTEGLRLVGKTPGGIGHATASEVINQQTIRLLAIAKDPSHAFVSPCADQSCTTVNQPTFFDGSYPITRRLFLVIKRDGKLDEQAGVAYANLLLSDEGQQLTKQVGFVPIR